MSNSIARLLLAALLAVAFGGAAEAPIKIRGYYFTFCRMPTFGLAEWKQIYDRIHSDGGNMVLLWVGGGFRSKKFPVTWQYNREHKNVQADFVRQLIDYGHTTGIKTLLGFTPFSYDGVNQYPIEHPELKAVQQNGKLAKLSGIHCWGYALNPSRPEAQKFMLEYVREMFFDFYPNSDGLMIESSDYAICFCSSCQGHYYEREFQFVKAISRDVWKAKPAAIVLVYPHYFSGKSVPGFNVTAAKLPYDPRWALFFTPHSAHLDPDLLKQAKTTIYWDTSTALHSPRQIQEGARMAVANKMTGFVPTLEGFSFRVEHPEGGEIFLLGKRLKPFGFDWLADGAQPFDELPVRVNRIAYREFTGKPDLDFGEFKRRLAADVFGSADSAAADDLLFLQEAFFADRSWFSASPMVSAALFRGKLAQGAISRDQVQAYHQRLARMKEVAARYRGKPGAEGQLGRVAAWIMGNWPEAEQRYLADHLR